MYTDLCRKRNARVHVHNGIICKPLWKLWNQNPNHVKEILTPGEEIYSSKLCPCSGSSAIIRDLFSLWENKQKNHNQDPEFNICVPKSTQKSTDPRGMIYWQKNVSTFTVVIKKGHTIIWIEKIAETRIKAASIIFQQLFFNSWLSLVNGNNEEGVMQVCSSTRQTIRDKFQLDLIIFRRQKADKSLGWNNMNANKNQQAVKTGGILPSTYLPLSPYQENNTDDYRRFDGMPISWDCHPKKIQAVFQAGNPCRLPSRNKQLNRSKIYIARPCLSKEKLLEIEQLRKEVLRASRVRFKDTTLFKQNTHDCSGFELSSSEWISEKKAIEQTYLDEIDAICSSRLHYKICTSLIDDKYLDTLNTSLHKSDEACLRECKLSRYEAVRVSRCRQSPRLLELSENEFNISVRSPSPNLSTSSGISTETSQIIHESTLSCRRPGRKVLSSKDYHMQKDNSYKQDIGLLDNNKTLKLQPYRQYTLDKEIRKIIRRGRTSLRHSLKNIFNKKSEGGSERVLESVGMSAGCSVEAQQQKNSKLMPLPTEDQTSGYITTFETLVRSSSPLDEYQSKAEVCHCSNNGCDARCTHSVADSLCGQHRDIMYGDMNGVHNLPEQGNAPEDSLQNQSQEDSLLIGRVHQHRRENRVKKALNSLLRSASARFHRHNKLPNTSS